MPFILGSTLARLNCSVTPEDAVLNRLWFKDNVLLATGTPVLNVEQAGVYRCHVLTTDGTLNSDNATISYIPVGKLHTVSNSLTVILHCIKLLGLFALYQTQNVKKRLVRLLR